MLSHEDFRTLAAATIIAAQRVASAAELAEALSAGFKGRIVIPRDVEWQMLDPRGPCGS